MAGAEGGEGRCGPSDLLSLLVKGGQPSLEGQHCYVWGQGGNFPLTGECENAGAPTLILHQREGGRQCQTRLCLSVFH